MIRLGCQPSCKKIKTIVGPELKIEVVKFTRHARRTQKKPLRFTTKWFRELEETIFNMQRAFNHAQTKDYNDLRNTHNLLVKNRKPSYEYSCLFYFLETMTYCFVFCTLFCAPALLFARCGRTIGPCLEVICSKAIRKRKTHFTTVPMIPNFHIDIAIPDNSCSMIRFQ